MNRKSRNWQGLASFLAAVGALWMGEKRTDAQIAPDTTLGSENSTITSTDTVDTINGGATRGANQFHSFQEFNVGEGRAAVFTNPNGIENILARVTGANPSNILGTLGTVGGNANLFLLNPNGIVFGQNARLDVGGAFIGTTANAVGFGDRGEFSATNPSNPGLLTVNPSALLFNQMRAAAIQNSSVAPSGLNPSAKFTATGLRVPDGNSLLLIGGDVNVNGGGLFAFGGRVELGGLAGAGMVGLNGSGSDLSLSFPDGVERSNVFLSNGAGVDVTASGGGNIGIFARNFEMTEGSYLTTGIESGLVSENSQAGNIDISTTDAIHLDNGTLVTNQVLPGANGRGGDVNLTTRRLRLENGAQINAVTSGIGKGGNLTVNAFEEVQLIGTSTDSPPSSSGLFTSAVPNSTGDAGNVRIDTNTFLVRDGAQVSAATFGEGDGGSLNVDAKVIQLIGTSNGGLPSGFFASAEENFTGNAGSINIRTDTFRVLDGAQVNAVTFGRGNGGSLDVVANDIQLIGRSNAGFSSGLFTSATENSTGNAGNLTVNTDNLSILNGARIGVQSVGTGTAGNMTIDARLIRLDNNASLLANTRSAKVDPDSEQATININSQNLFISRNSKIFTKAQGQNVIGGNINIDTNFLFAIENSDISTDSVDFRGGIVRINAFGIFGTQYRTAPNDRTSDITAAGASPQLSGIVELNIPEIEPSSDFDNLPSVPIATEIELACTPSADRHKSEFVISGRGGLPDYPHQLLGGDAIDVNLVTLDSQTEDRAVSKTTKNSTILLPTPTVEATEWKIDSHGKVVLTARASTDQNLWHLPAGCSKTN